MAKTQEQYPEIQKLRTLTSELLNMQRPLMELLNDSKSHFNKISMRLEPIILDTSQYTKESAEAFLDVANCMKFEEKFCFYGRILVNFLKVIDRMEEYVYVDICKAQSWFEPHPQLKTYAATIEGILFANNSELTHFFPGIGDKFLTYSRLILIARNADSYDGYMELLKTLGDMHANTLPLIQSHLLEYLNGIEDMLDTLAHSGEVSSQQLIIKIMQDAEVSEHVGMFQVINDFLTHNENLHNAAEALFSYCYTRGMSPIPFFLAEPRLKATGMSKMLLDKFQAVGHLHVAKALQLIEGEDCDVVAQPLHETSTFENTPTVIAQPVYESNPSTKDKKLWSKIEEMPLQAQKKTIPLGPEWVLIPTVDVIEEVTNDNTILEDAPHHADDDTPYRTDDELFEVCRLSMEAMCKPRSELYEAVQIAKIVRTDVTVLKALFNNFPKLMNQDFVGKLLEAYTLTRGSIRVKSYLLRLNNEIEKTMHHDKTAQGFGQDAAETKVPSSHEETSDDIVTKAHKRQLPDNNTDSAKPIQVIEPGIKLGGKKAKLFEGLELPNFAQELENDKFYETIRWDIGYDETKYDTPPSSPHPQSSYTLTASEDIYLKLKATPYNDTYNLCLKLQTKNGQLNQKDMLMLIKSSMDDPRMLGEYLEMFPEMFDTFSAQSFAKLIKKIPSMADMLPKFYSLYPTANVDNPGGFSYAKSAQVYGGECA